MQNDVLKNNIVPWQEKGRWYHGLWDTSTDSFITEKTDSFINDHCTVSNISGVYYLFVDNPNKRPIEAVCIPQVPFVCTYAAGVGATGTKRYLTDGTTAISFMLYGCFTSGLIDCYFYIFE